MTEAQGEFFRQERMLGRRVIVILPIFVALVAATLMYMAMPVRYFFTVQDGEMCMMAGRLSWLGTQRCQVMDPIPVEGMNVESLTTQVFETQADGLAVLRSFFLKRIQHQAQELLPLERELVRPYATLVKDLKGARSAGADGLDRQISVLQGWLDIYAKKSELASEVSGSTAHK